MREYSVGDFVTYKQNGICRIGKIVKQNFAGMGEREYFELSPVYDEKTVIFIPCDSPSLKSEMRYVLPENEIDSIISESENTDFDWIADARERTAVYGEIIESGDRSRILRIIKALSLYKKQLSEEKKKFYASDAKLLATAEKVITEEFAFVLGIERSEVIPYIIGKLGK